MPNLWWHTTTASHSIFARWRRERCFQCWPFHADAFNLVGLLTNVRTFSQKFQVCLFFFSLFLIDVNVFFHSNCSTISSLNSHFVCFSFRLVVCRSQHWRRPLLAIQMTPSLFVLCNNRDNSLFDCEQTCCELCKLIPILIPIALLLL